MTNCPTCEQNHRDNETSKLETLKAKFRAEAKAQRLTEYAILETKNSNPGYMWRPIGHDDCARIGVHQYGIVY